MKTDSVHFPVQTIDKKAPGVSNDTVGRFRFLQSLLTCSSLLDLVLVTLCGRRHV